MSVSHTITRGYHDGAVAYSDVETVTSGAATFLDESIPGASANLPVALAFNKSKLKSIRIWADRDMDLYFNDVSGGSPDPHIALKANSPFVWSLADGYFAVPFPSNVTVVNVTLAAGVASILHLRAVLDPT